jgi:hypothetical protein
MVRLLRMKKQVMAREHAILAYVMVIFYIYA